MGPQAKSRDKMLVLVLLGLSVNHPEPHDEAIKKIVQMSQDKNAWEILHRVSTVVDHPLLYNTTLGLVKDPTLTLQLLKKCPEFSRLVAETVEQIGKNSSLPLSNSTKFRDDMQKAGNDNLHKWQHVCARHQQSAQSGAVALLEVPEVGNAPVPLDSPILSCPVLGPLGALVGAVGAIVALMAKDNVGGGETNKFIAYAVMMIITSLNGPFLLSNVACHPEQYFQILRPAQSTAQSDESDTATSDSARRL
eukprot:c14325_g1_i1.p1 GENE.c14325_g1_i1~~c14325_g1_i1.p1  ORF type:complete len:250 (-),score=51.07 c14325_g1_i1:110-859(-)